MKFVITFDTDNSAFGETFEDAAFEIARVVRKAALGVENLPLRPGDRTPLFDSNGNRIGFYGLMEEGGA